MARSHSRFVLSLWSDEDFLALSSGAQRLYMLLVGQPNLGYAGILPLTVKRWASRAEDTSAEDIERYLAELEQARYIVIDEDTAELLVRTFMRNDEVYKQPNVMVSAGRDAQAVASRLIRQHLAAEVVKILGIPDLKPGSKAALEGLLEALPEPFPRPVVDPSPNPTANPSDNPTAYPRGRGWVTSVSTEGPSPSPSPTPTPVPVANDDPTTRLLTEHVSAYAQPVPTAAQAKVKVEIMRLVADGITEPRIRAGLARLREKQLAASLLPQLVTEASQPARTQTARQLDAAMERAREAEAGMTERRALP